ncbi:MAG TPA: non-heme iron oxygenase ferredoxin subunit [Anaerolineae bacterium]|nr:non-heme iron oxygenase ferredoxin subunit [Anaerolineae bacterium]
MSRLVKVAETTDIAAGGKMVVEIDGTEIAVFNVDNEQYYAVEDICSHDGGPLGEGELIETYEVECPRHGGRFDIRTGKALVMPAFESIEAFPVTVQNDGIFLTVDW